MVQCSFGLSAGVSNDDDEESKNKEESPVDNIDRKFLSKSCEKQDLQNSKSLWYSLLVNHSWIFWNYFNFGAWWRLSLQYTNIPWYSELQTFFPNETHTKQSSAQKTNQAQNWIIKLYFTVICLELSWGELRRGEAIKLTLMVSQNPGMSSLSIISVKTFLKERLHYRRNPSLFSLCFTNPESDFPSRPMGEELAEPLVHQQDLGLLSQHFSMPSCPYVWERTSCFIQNPFTLLLESTEHRLVIPSGGLYFSFFSTTRCGVILEMTSSDSLQLYSLTELSNPSIRAFWNSWWYRVWGQKRFDFINHRSK